MLVPLALAALLAAPSMLASTDARAATKTTKPTKTTKTGAGKSTIAPSSGPPTWTVNNDPAFLTGNTGPRATVYTGVGGGGGRPWVLAGVWQKDATRQPEPTVWTSDDTRKWAKYELPLPKGATGGQVQGMATKRGSIIAVGTIWTGADADPGIWTSINRTTWELFAEDRAAGQQSLNDVAITEDGFVAVGNETVAEEVRSYVLRGSRSRLTRITGAALPKSAERLRNLQDVASDGKQRVVVVANVGEAGAARAHAWYSRDGGQTFANNSSDFPTQKLNYGLVRPDLSPTQTPATVSAVNYIADPVEPSLNRFVALGQVFPGTDAADQNGELVAWSSRDGARWQRFGPDYNVDLETSWNGSGSVPFDFTLAGGAQYAGVVSLLDPGSPSPAVLGLLPVRGSGLITQTVALPAEAVGATPGPMLWGSIDRSAGVLTVSNTSGRPEVNFFDMETERFLPARERQVEGFPEAQPKRSLSVVVGSRLNRRYLGVDYPVVSRSSASGARPTASGNAKTWAANDEGLVRLSKPLIGDGTPRSMFTAGNETYVVGQKPGTDLYDGALWKMRPDGNLLEVPATGLGGELAQVLIAGTKSSKGWFVVGTIGTADGSNDGAVWTSADGRAWRQLPDEIFGGAGDQVATTVCTLSDGRAVVGGYAPATETGPTVPVAWFQDELGGWNGTLLSESAGYIADCASTPAGVVLAGVEGNKAGVWKTTDGPTYTAFELPDQGPGFVSITSVAAGPNGTVLAGQVDDGSGTRDVAVWVASASPSDKTRRLSLPAAFKGWGEQFVDHILLEGNRAVMVGSSDAAPRVWESPNVFRK